MSTDVPEGWRWTEVGEFLTLDRAMLPIDPDSKYVTIGIKSYGGGIFHYPPKRGSDLGSLSHFRLRAGCLLVSNIMAWEGAVTVTSSADEGLLASSRFLPYVTDESRVDVNYLQYYFATGPGHRQIRLASTGSAKRNRTLGISRFEELTIPLPPLVEQQKVIEILSAVDSAIQAGHKTVQQAQQVKKALEQELLAGVISTDGRSCSAFADADCGRIPIHWRCVRHGDVLAEHGQRRGQRAELRALSLTKTQGLVEASERFGRRLHADDMSRYRVAAEGEIVIDPMLLWDGAIARLWRFSEGLVSPDYRVFRINDSADPRFLEYTFKSRHMRRLYRDVSRGTNRRRRRIGRTAFLNLPLALPPLVEQRNIAQKLSDADQVVYAAQESVGIHERMRSGLLQDLLTGKVRVTA